ncbi:MAG: hypothetical protein ACT6WE_07620, partial [Shinella sp.]|uniref:hypothetical protein n=1 Tax=Shinella sp. TaxID=1870904 RepID=UPI004035A40B
MPSNKIMPAISRIMVERTNAAFDIGIPPPVKPASQAATISSCGLHATNERQKAGILLVVSHLNGSSANPETPPEPLSGNDDQAGGNDQHRAG